MRPDPALLHPTKTRSAPNIVFAPIEPPPEPGPEQLELPLPPVAPEASKAKAKAKAKDPNRAQQAKKSRKATKARKSRRRPGPRMVAVLAVVLALMGADRPLARPGIEVTVDIGGVPRLIRLPEGATAEEAFVLAQAVPQAGRLLSAVTRSVLDPNHSPPGYAINGLTVPPAMTLHSGATVSALEYPDETESVADVAEAIPAPPLPLVEKELWHPGRDGKSMVTRGTVSGEEVKRIVVTEPVAPAPVTDKVVALTFDDGPWPGSERFLDVLKEKNVKAMFCVVGYTIGRPANAGMLRRAVAEGHSLCNHTVSHDSHLPEKPPDRINAEIADANAIITSHVGSPRPVFYRPPGGQLSPTVIDIAHKNGHRVLHWSIDTVDYADTTAAPQILERVMTHLKPGAVILMHDGGGDQTQTLVALGTIIDQIRAAGYQFVVPDQIAPLG